MQYSAQDLEHDLPLLKTELSETSTALHMECAVCIISHYSLQASTTCLSAMQVFYMHA